MYTQVALIVGNVVLGSIAVFAICKWLFRRDTRVEDRRKDAAEAAAELRKDGFEHIPDFLICYAVGDYSGMYSLLKMWLKALRDPERRRDLLNRFLSIQLKRCLDDPQTQPKVMAIVQGHLDAEEAKKQRIIAEAMKSPNAKTEPSAAHSPKAALEQP